ncbi:MAG: SBBP repeat-containing protein, partial [Candidatus Rokubacteria bacterium]|nr:SBBP repeat-containing protein [Candidatus Rokubacteria bacterium]
IAVDTSGNAYVTGRTSSTDFPTMYAFQVALGGGFYDAFVTKLNAAGSALVYSTYLGGSGDDRGFGIAVDGAGNAYLTGRAGPTDFPTLNPLPGTSCNGDAFVTKLNAAGSALVYSTCLGGGGENPNGAGIAVDAVGNAYVTGATSSADFPTASFQAVLGGGMDAFVAKISDVSLPPAAPTGLTATQASPSQVDLAWSHDGSDETGFELERDTDQSGIFDVVGTVGADVLAFQDTSVQVNRSYTYQVKALGAAGDSAFSPSATVTVRAGKLLVLPVRLTFSGVAVGNSDTKTVTLQNVGQGTLTGSVASALSGSFTLLAGGGTFSLAPGATLSVTVQFSPTTRGTARSGLTVTSDDPARPATRVQVTGIVR